MLHAFIGRALRPLGQIAEGEGATAVLMFSYSFLAMTAYNIVKPITRSKFISALGADNLPYIQLAAGLLIGFVMVGYSWLIARLPRRWSLQISQGCIAGLLLGFWFLFRTGSEWVSVGFYFFGLILGILLISQFWTLANVVYDARQAKRLFGFIGGGAPLGGIAGSLILTGLTARLGTVNLLLVSAAIMLGCMAIVSTITLRERVGGPVAVEEEKGIGARKAIELLRNSKHLKLIALVISFAAVGAAVIEQQLNMATEAFKGREATDAITSFLGQVQLWTSAIGFLIQIWLTSRIHRLLGIGFALMILPVSLGTTASVMLLNAALWAPSLARVLDQSLRYTVDKTTREILYMPLPVEIKYEAKPFVDVTVDRFAKGLAAVLLLVFIQPWGLQMDWQQLSYASVLMTGLWLVMAVRARRGYQRAFRESIETQSVKPADMRLAEADLSTVETLIQELAGPDERRVLYAIDLLESLRKGNLVTPLLLYHESSAVRARALGVISGAQPEISGRWLPAIQRMVADENTEVRIAAIGALANMRDDQAEVLLRALMNDGDPRTSMTAALVMTQSHNEDDAAAARGLLQSLAGDLRASSARARRDLAVALRHISGTGLRRLLIPLLQDSNEEVAAEAMTSVRHVGRVDCFFVPTLIALLRSRRLKSHAREHLIACGEDILPILEHFLNDPGEEIWVRRHLPATIARIPCQRSMDILVRSLEAPDAFLRFKALAGIEKLRRTQPHLHFNPAPLDKLALEEAGRFLRHRAIFRSLFEQAGIPCRSLLARALSEKMGRSLDRMYRLLCVMYPWRDVTAARWAIERGDGRSRAGALEYLDNLLKGGLRQQALAALEQPLPALQSGRSPAGAGGTTEAGRRALLELFHDRDPEIASTAIYQACELGLAELSREIEEVLAEPRSDDWTVFEAASWVLAAFRLADERRRKLWREPLPAVELTEQLRRLPLFSSVSLDELFRLARAGRQVRHDDRSLLYEESRIPQTLQFLLDGCLSAKSGASEPRRIESPAALAVREVLQGRPMGETVRSAGTAVCLALNAEEFHTILSLNIELIEGLFGMLAVANPDLAGAAIHHGEASAELAALPAGELKPIDKALILGTVPLFSEVSADEMLWLAAISEEVPLTEGSALTQQGDRPALFVVVSGELTLTPAEGAAALTAGPSDAVGLQAALTGVPSAAKCTVRRHGRALRVDRDDLFDLLSQRPEMLQQLFS
ncbi:MAG: cyclic nucleotide-binding domain-containing protein, partial [Acidobacteria bacterium]|nr:cyclic nucleotide-binding domain-containing protein [Acidobacteriota bacterium]